MELFELLEKHTGEKGNFCIYFNEHISSYINIEEKYNYYTATMDEEERSEVEHIDWSKDIYEVFWYKDTPVGSYHMLGNTIEEIVKQVREIIGCTLFGNAKRQAMLQKKE